MNLLTCCPEPHARETSRFKFMGAHLGSLAWSVEIMGEHLDRWKFFTTDETMTSRLFDGKFKGVKLPCEAVEKIYYKNVIKLFPEFKNKSNKK